MADLPLPIRRALDGMARALAGYYQPVRTPPDGAVTYDEVDYGQAAHVLTVLIGQGWQPSEGPLELPDELAHLVATVAELPEEGLDQQDPLLSTPIILHLTVVRRLQALSRHLTTKRYFGSMLRDWVLDQLVRVEQDECEICTCCTNLECSVQDCRDGGCECSQPAPSSQTPTVVTMADVAVQ